MSPDLLILGAFLLAIAALIGRAWYLPADPRPDPASHFSDPDHASELHWRLACELSRRRSEQRR